MRYFITFLIFLIAATILGPAARAGENNGFKTVTGPCNLVFPKDHGSHEGYRTEWWYYTGNLKSASGDEYGFQLTFFRSQLSPNLDRQKWPRPPSAWRTQQVYLAHSAISNISEKQHLQAELVSREALNMAGVNQAGNLTHIYLKNWSVHLGPDRHLLRVATNRFSYELNLEPTKPLVLHGDQGYSLKGSTPERASCYYSFTRLKAEGQLSIGNQTVSVKGLAWMDHEFSTAALEPGLQGWDWFSLHLSDETEVMGFVLRKETGGIGPASSATIVDRHGGKRHLTANEFILTVNNTWKSPRSKAVYPAGWRLQIFPTRHDLTIKPSMADQEMHTTGSTGVIYWEGSVAVGGAQSGKPVTGQGYVELTGYHEPFQAPM